MKRECRFCKCQDTLIFKDLGIEVESSVHDHGIKFEDVIIPKGWRLLKLNEAVELLNREKFVEATNFKNKANDFYIQQPFPQDKAAWLGCYGRDFDLDAGDCLGSGYASRGVLFCRDLEGEQ